MEKYKSNFYNLIIVNSHNKDSLNFVKFLRKLSKNKAIILFSPEFNNNVLNQFMHYYIDGYITNDFPESSLNKLINNIFDRQEEQDNIFQYIKCLETIEIDSTHNTYKNNDNTIIFTENKIENNRNNFNFKEIKNYDTEDFISANEFFSYFDDLIFDKIENLILISSRIDEIIFLLEQSKNNFDSYFNEIKKLSNELKNFFIILDNLNHFKILNESFELFIDFLNNFENNEIDSQKIDVFTQNILFLYKDLDKWLNVIFIHRDTDNIYYFDSSFYENIINLMSIFKYNENYYEHDIEFF